MRGEVDVARRLAAGAPDLEPGKAAVDGLVDGRRGIDRLAVRPHPLVPAFAEQPVGLLQHGLGFGPHLGRLRGEDVGHRARLAEFLVQSLAVAARQGRGVMFRRHPTSSCKDRPGRWSGRIERRPAAVLFVAAGSVLAGVVEQPLADLLPDRLGAVQADGVGLLDFDDALAAAARDAQHVALDFGKLPLPQLGVV